MFLFLLGRDLRRTWRATVMSPAMKEERAVGGNRQGDVLDGFCLPKVAVLRFRCWRTGPSFLYAYTILPLCNSLGFPDLGNCSNALQNVKGPTSTAAQLFGLEGSQQTNPGAVKVARYFLSQRPLWVSCQTPMLKQTACLPML